MLAVFKKNGVFFLDNVLPDNIISQIDKGVMIGAGRREDSAEIGGKEDTVVIILYTKIFQLN